MKKFTVTAVICLSVLMVCLVALIIYRPSSKPDANEPNVSALSGHGKNTFAENGLPMPEGKTLLTESSFAQCMADADGDGKDDRITCATLGDEYETEYICVQFSNGKTPDSEYSCYNGYAHPELSCGKYNDITVIYVKGESQGSDGEQMVHPFVLGEGGKIVPAVNVKATYMEETSVFKLPCFSDLKIGETYDTGRIVVETEYAPTLYISVSASILNDSAYDEEYGLRILSANCEMSVDTGNNTVTCIFDCAVIEADDSYSDEVTPVELVVTLAFEGREFTVSEWKYNIADGTEYSFEGDVPAPSSVPDATTSPQGTGNNGKSYLPTYI